jgi:DHA1 family multidrug resistance protein-like MFS transporter
MQKDTITTLNLSITSFLVLLGMSLIAPILPFYAETFNVNYTLIGLVVSAFGIGRILLDLPTGFLAKKYRKKMIMIMGLTLVSFSSFLAGFAPNYGILLLARFIEGIGSALYVTTATVYLALVASPERRGRLMSIYSGFILLGTIFGPSFGGIIANFYGIRAPFHVYAIVTAIGIIPTLILPRIENSNEDDFKFKELTRNAGKSLLNPNFLLILPAIFTLFFIRTGVRSTLVPLYSENNLKLSVIEVGLLLTLAGLATASTMVPIGNISDRIGRRNPLILSLLLSIPFILWIPFTKDIVTLAICLAFYGALIGLSGPIAAYVTDVSPPDQIEIYMGMYRTIGDIGFVIGPILMGYIADVTSPSGNLVEWPPFFVAMIIMLISGLILLKAPNTIPKN